MAAMEGPRADWNRRQRELRRLLESGEDHAAALDLFNRQHAQLHTASMAGTENWSYEDELLDGISEAQFRSIPDKGEHSIAWVLWHIARVEDVTMNLLVAKRKQVLHDGEWQGSLGSPIEHTGNEMSRTQIEALSASLDLAALRAYRQAVGQRTRAVVMKLRPEEMGRKPSPQSPDRIWTERAVLPEAKAIVDYWSRRTVVGLLLMPPTRHLLVHLNEAAAIKQQLG